MKEIILSCGTPRCCPKIKFEKNKVTITDDYGGKVTLTNAQFEMLCDCKCDCETEEGCVCNCKLEIRNKEE